MNSTFENLKQEIKNQIKDNTVVVCVSTGVDSMVLFHLLKDN